MVLLSVLLAVSVTFAQTKKEERKGFESKPYSVSGVSYKAPAYAPQTGKDVLLNEGFEGAVPPAGWSVLDVDGDTYTWAPGIAGFAVHSGAQAASSASYINDIGALTPNNWLITPQVALPAGSNFDLKYWICAQDAAYAGEHYKVVLSTTGNAQADFTVTLYEETMTAKVPGAWYERVVSLGAYAGQSVYIAYVHYDCTDMFYMNLDDVSIQSPATAPIATLNLNTADFGLVNAGQSSTLNGFLLSNIGIGTVTVTSVTSTSAEFTTSIVPADVNVVPGTPYAFSVTFSPVDAGAEAATITITTNAGDLTIAVTGEGFELPEGMIEIGNGEFVGTHLPLELYFGYTYSQSLFLQSEVNVADQRISKIQYHYYKDGTAGTAPFTDEIKVYMGHTSATAITDWVAFNELTEVYTGTLTCPNAGDEWVEIVLTVPFVYNNTDNLVIAIEENTPGYHAGSDEFLAHNFDGVTNMSIYYYNDGTNPDPAAPPAGTLSLYRPNVRVQFEDIPSGPAIAVSPSAIDFGLIEAGTSLSVDVTFMNTGGADLTITGVNGVSAPFSSMVPTIVLAPGAQSSPTTITFAPTAVGEYTQTISYTSDATQGSASVVLTGAAYPEGILFERFEGESFPPLGWSADENSWNVYNYSAYEGSQLAYLSGTNTGKLITPKLEIVANDTIYFFAKNSSYSGGSLSLKYSADMATWNDLAVVPVTSTYALYAVALDPAIGVNYLAFDGVAYIYLDFVMGPMLYAPEVAPGPATDPDPADMSVDAYLSTTLSWTGVLFADGYKISVGTDNPPTNLVNGMDLGMATEYLIEGLEMSTVYYWSVVPYNEFGNCTTAPVWSFTTMGDPYIGTFPYTMGFEGHDGLVPPVGWTNDGTKLWSTGTEANSGSFCARATYSPAEAILTTPYIDNNPAKKIEFWWKDDDITAKSAKRNDSKVAGFDTTYFEVSVDHGMTWSVVSFLSAADNESEYSKYSTNLVGYETDSLLIRWRDVSDGSFSAWGVGLDDILIKEMSTTPEVVINATAHNFNNVVVGSQSNSGQFTITNDGVGTLTVTSITDLSTTEFTTTFVPAAVSLGTGETYSFTFSYSPTAEGADNAAFEIVTNGQGANGGIVSVALSGVGVTIPPFTGEDFEGAEFPPLGWTMIDNDNDGNNWLVLNGVDYAHAGENCAISESYINNVGALTPDNWLITPKFEVTAETSLFNWWTAAQDPDYPADKYGVYVSTTGTSAADFTELFNETLTSAEWAKRGVSLVDYVGQEVYVAFRHFDCSDNFVMKIDDVELTAFVNHAPEFITTPGTSVNVNGNYTYNAKAVDEDNQTLTMTGVTVPSWLTMTQTGNGMVRLLGSPDVAGSYPVEISATDGELTANQAWTIMVTGINDGVASMVALYPNPVKDVLTITSSSAISEVKIFDALGKAVMVENVNKAETTVDMSSLSSGIYIVNVTTVDGKVVSKRITK